MHYFTYKGGELYAEGVPMSALAETYGTPLYVYSKATLLRHINAYSDAFDGIQHIICYAVKANSNLSLLSLLASEGVGADVISGGELYRALKAGISPSKIVYAGVGKTEDEIRYAIKSGILMFNIESEEELSEINRIAGSMKKKARISLRVNPDIDPQTHPYISTGLKKHKFGIPISDALECYCIAYSMQNVEVVGIHKHIGSQITKTSPYTEALEKVLLLVDSLMEKGITLRYLDIGGGLGITYNNEKPPEPKDLARKVIPTIKGRGLTLIAEPGRSIVGNAGVLLTKTLYVKHGEDRDFVIVDAAMNDLMRPTMYDAYHEILPFRKSRRQSSLCDVVGPICESGDFLARGRKISKASRGDYFAVMSAGAYGFSMSSNYNSRPRAAEVMVSGKDHQLIGRRETYHDLIRREAV